MQRSIFVRGCVYWCPDASRLAVTPTKKVSVFIPQTSSQMIRNLLIVKITSAGGKTAPEMGKPIGDGFMSIPNGVEDEGLPFN